MPTALVKLLKSPGIVEECFVQQVEVTKESGILGPSSATFRDRQPLADGLLAIKLTARD